MKRSEEQNGTTKLPVHKSLQTLAQGPRRLHCVLAALITFLSFGPRAQAQCPTITPHTASGSATRGKIGTPCNTCPDHYYLARGTGSGTEFTFYSYFWDSVPNQQIWSYSMISGSWTAIDPERFSNGDLRTREPRHDGCSHDGFATSGNGVWERSDNDVYYWGMTLSDHHTHGTCIFDGLNRVCQGTNWIFYHNDGTTTTSPFSEVEKPDINFPWQTTVQTTETRCTYSQTVSEQQYNLSGERSGTTAKQFNWSDTWLTSEFTTAWLEGLVKSLAEERLPGAFPSGGPNGQTPTGTATLTAPEDCATASSCRWKAQITGTVQNERYEVVYRRAEFFTSRGWTNSWVTNLVTAPASTWWYPSDAGEVLGVPSWEPGICPSTPGEHLVSMPFRNSV